MKVVDIADEIFRELSEPSTLSIPAIAYWVRSNVGELNNYLNTSFRVSHSTFEIEESVDVTGRQPVSFNSAVDNSTLELQFEEKAVLKKMYNVHYYDQQLRSTLGAASNDPVVEVVSDGSKVRKINKNELSKTYASLKRQEYDELSDMITAYKLRLSAPVQVAGGVDVGAEPPKRGQPEHRVQAEGPAECDAHDALHQLPRGAGRRAGGGGPVGAGGCGGGPQEDVLGRRVRRRLRGRRGHCGRRLRRCGRGSGRHRRADQRRVWRGRRRPRQHHCGAAAGGGAQAPGARRGGLPPDARLQHECRLQRRHRPLPSHPKDDWRGRWQ